MKNTPLLSGVLSAVVALLFTPASKAAILTANPADNLVYIGVNPTPTLPVDGGGTVGTASDTTYSVGNTGIYGNFGGLNTVVIPFLLPNFGVVASPFTSASFSITQNGGINSFAGLAIDLYGLGARASSAVLGSDYFAGALDTTDATLLQGNFITSNGGSPNPSGTVYTTSGSALGTYLNAAYNNGANAGNYAFLRLNVNTLPGDFFKTIGFDSGDATSNQPFITYSAIPEPSAVALVGLGLVGLLGVRRRVNI